MLKNIVVSIALLSSVLNPFSLASKIDSLSEIDKSDVIDDISSVIDLTELTSIKSVTFIDFEEYCYGSEDDYELLVYLYIPYGTNIVNNLSLNKVEISFGNTNVYQKLGLKLLDNESNIYKFKIVLNDYVKDYVLNNLDKENRKYFISGIELLNAGGTNAKEYNIGLEYFFSGYAKGINNESSTESTLKKTKNNISEIINLDVKSTFYRFDTGNDNIKSQLDSVYFSIPNYYLDKYDELSEINFEYYEYKTSPIVCLREEDYNYFKDYVGKKWSETNPGLELYAFEDVLHEGGLDGGIGHHYYYNYIYSEKDLSSSSMPFERPMFKWNNYLTWLFNIGSDVNEDIFIESTDLLNYLYSYNKSFFNGSNNKGISYDLLMGDVDQGHKRGYNNRIVKSTDAVNLLIEDSSFWSQFKDFFGLGDNVLKELDPFKKIGSNDSITSDSLYINERDLNDFKSYLDKSNRDDKTTYLFRFNTSTYRWNYIYTHRVGDPFVSGQDGIVCDQTIYLDFDIISLTFSKRGLNKVIPVVSNPIDIIGDIEAPALGEDWFDNFLEGFRLFFKILLGVMLFVLMIWLLSLIFNLLGISIKDILNFIFVKPFKWIKSKFSKKKKYKNSVNSKKKVKNKTRYKKKYNAKK